MRSHRVLVLSNTKKAASFISGFIHTNYPNFLPEKTPIFANPFPARGIRLAFFLLTGFLVVPVFFDIGQNTRPLAGFRETAEGLFKGLIFTYVYAIHGVLTFFPSIRGKIY